MSARRWQGKRGGGQWSFSKSFDTFCPLGPALLVADPSVNPDNLRLETRLNGKTVQQSSTSDMIFNVAEIISFLSQSTTLLPGTVILTGTPEGVWSRLLSKLHRSLSFLTLLTSLPGAE